MEPLSADQIAKIIPTFCSKLGIDKDFPNKIYDFIDAVYNQFGLTIDEVEDQSWMRGITNGHYDPNTLTIRLPASVIRNAQSKNPMVQRNALHIILHELGHFGLSHKAVLHDTDEPPSPEIDSEVQADLFADFILSYLGISAQLELAF